MFSKLTDSLLPHIWETSIVSVSARVLCVKTLTARWYFRRILFSMNSQLAVARFAGVPFPVRHSSSTFFYIYMYIALLKKKKILSPDTPVKSVMFSKKLLTIMVCLLAFMLYVSSHQLWS